MIIVLANLCNGPVSSSLGRDLSRRFSRRSKRSKRNQNFYAHMSTVLSTTLEENGFSSSDPSSESDTDDDDSMAGYSLATSGIPLKTQSD